jgi:hypothetical protein
VRGQSERLSAQRKASSTVVSTIPPEPSFIPQKYHGIAYALLLTTLPKMAKTTYPCFMRIWGWLGLAAGLLWAQECDIIFVSPNGGTGLGTGARENPAELNYAISNLLTPTIRRLYLSYGIYTLTQTLPLYNNLEIEGGFDPNQGWRKTNLFPTIIFRAAVNPTLIPIGSWRLPASMSAASASKT